MGAVKTRLSDLPNNTLLEVKLMYSNLAKKCGRLWESKVQSKELFFLPLFRSMSKFFISLTATWEGY